MRFFQAEVITHKIESISVNVIIEFCVYFFWGLLWVSIMRNTGRVYSQWPRSRTCLLRFKVIQFLHNSKEAPKMV